MLSLAGRRPRAREALFFEEAAEMALGAGNRSCARERGYSSVGRAPALQAGGHRFESDYLHQYGLIAQLVRAHA